jgi:hypothetical protein
MKKKKKKNQKEGEFHSRVERRVVRDAILETINTRDCVQTEDLCALATAI